MTATFGLKFTCRAAPVGMPKVLIVSHERSGTHFMMNSLALNFGYVSNPWVNLDYELGVNFHSAIAFESLMSHFKGQWVANLFKTHHEFGFFADWILKFKDEFKIIYMVREASAVLRSYQRFLQSTPWYEGPKLAVASEFIRAHPVGSLTRLQYQYAQTMTHRWCNHVQGWLKGGQLLGNQRFMPVLYSELDETFEDTMRQISMFLQLPLADQLKRPDRYTNVVCPSDPSSDSTQDFLLTDDDCQFLDDVTADTRQLINKLLPIANASSQTVGFPQS